MWLLITWQTSEKSVKEWLIATLQKQTPILNLDSCLTFIKSIWKSMSITINPIYHLLWPSLSPGEPHQWLAECIYSPLCDLYGWSVGLWLVTLFLGTHHPSNKNEGYDSRGKEDEKKEDCNIWEANAGHWGGGEECLVIRGTVTWCLWSHIYRTSYKSALGSHHIYTHCHTDCKLYTYYIQQLYECHYTVDDSTENVKQFVIFLQRRDEKTHGSCLYSKYAAEASSWLEQLACLYP